MPRPNPALRCARIVIVLACGAASTTPPALAQQGFDPVGARAEGMGGAFVAVADDATASYWNPAGLPAIPLFDTVLHWTASDLDPDGAARQTAGSTRTAVAAVALPVVAVSYLSRDMEAFGPVATAAGDPDRQDPGTAAVGHALRTHQVGLTLVQSLTDYVVVGGTVRLVRAEAVVQPFQTASDGEGALESLRRLDGRTSTRFDADLGVMAYLGRLRVGLTVRDLGAPSYDAAGGGSIDVERTARLGVAWGPEPGRGRRRWTIAADADLTAVERAHGRSRVLAVGGERWWGEGRLALRGGLRAHTTGAARPAASGGASLAVWSGLLLEAQATAGGEDAERGWSVGARVTF
jgi:F plasmid transfer operon, TraF, protein